MTAGCVERRLLLKSEPPGARVLLDNEPKGVTPVELPFSYYGTRDLVLELDGYQTVHTLIDVDEPLYQIIGADFVTDVLVSATITDEHEFTFLLAPVPERAFDSRDAERAIERARELRERATREDESAAADGG